MDDHHDLGVLRQLVDIAGHRLDVEELLDLRQRLLHGNAHLRIAVEAETVKQRDHRLAAGAELGDETRQIVFQKRLALGREGLDRCAAISGIGDGKPEEHLVAG